MYVCIIHLCTLFVLVQLLSWRNIFFQNDSAGAEVQGMFSFCPIADSKSFPIFVERFHFYYVIFLCLFFVLLFGLGTVFGVDLLLFLSCIINSFLAVLV
jgi:hypothetical protein